MDKKSEMHKVQTDQSASSTNSKKARTENDIELKDRFYSFDEQEIKPLELKDQGTVLKDDGLLKPTDPNKDQNIEFSFGHPSLSNNHEEDPDQLNQIDSKQINTSENDKLLQNLRSSLEKKKQVALKSMFKTEGLLCPICMDMIISCRIAICGHTFCHQCIAECMLRKKECPQCRKNIRKKVLQPSALIDNSVKMYVFGKKYQGDSEAYNKWNERMQAYHQWIDQSKLRTVKVGDQIDACDTENIWCKATVELIIKTQNRKDLLYIHYEGWNRKYDEFLYMDSHRLAPLGSYTNRLDIPVYRMMGNRGSDGQLSMMYAVVLSNAAEEARLQEQERRLSQAQQAEENDDEDDEVEDE